MIHCPREKFTKIKSSNLQNFSYFVWLDSMDQRLVGVPLVHSFQPETVEEPPSSSWQTNRDHPDAFSSWTRDRENSCVFEKKWYITKRQIGTYFYIPEQNWFFQIRINRGWLDRFEQLHRQWFVKWSVNFGNQFAVDNIRHLYRRCQKCHTHRQNYENVKSRKIQM